MNRLAPHHPHGNFTAVISKQGEWWVGFVEEVSGVNAQEKTKEALMESLKCALKDIIELQREDLLSSMPSRSRFKEVSFSL